LTQYSYYVKTKFDKENDHVISRNSKQADERPVDRDGYSDPGACCPNGIRSNGFAQPAPQSGKALVGTWRVVVTPINCATGAPLPSFVA
jgi:hypothetical protein